MKTVSLNSVIDYAKGLLESTEVEISPSEKKEQKKYAGLIRNRKDKILLSRMLDESSQIRNNKKLSRRLKYLLDKYGVPGFFNGFDTWLMKIFIRFGYLFDFIAVPVFKKKLRQDTAKVIIDEKESVFHRHLNLRKKESIGQNVNLLGEVVLGDKEADIRYQHYLDALKDPLINYISVKISGIYAQINPLDVEQNKADLCERMSAIYRQAMKYPFTDENGNQRYKFVNLDMEEYKDIHLTLDVFIAVLSLPEFRDLPAGIVVQAYLPDAGLLQARLLEFARKRVGSGGEPLKMRLVKGANLAMETVISSLKGWENPVFDNKTDVDANYLRLLDIALKPENASVLHIGVASHNLFTIAYAHLLSQEYETEQYLSFEMLEGMANYLPRVMQSVNKQIILYTPVVKDEHFLNAVSYLVRRLDENTGKDNFLSYSFNLEYGTENWNFLKAQFEEAYRRKDIVDTLPFRKQDRNKPLVGKVMTEFENEPDTDFDLLPNKIWADFIRKKWMKSVQDKPYVIPVQTGSKVFETPQKLSFYDHNRNDEVCICEVSLSEKEHVQSMIDIAVKDEPGWGSMEPAAIKSILHKVALNMGNKRGDLIGCMAAITGKTFFEGDVEVSEAIDFCRYYPLSLDKFYALEDIRLSAKGVILVIPPWNFPTAIPVGGVAAALSGGNRVILKPATVAFPIAWEFAQCFWDAGVPREALQLVCAAGREPVNFLATHPAVKHMIFTGGTDTAMTLIGNNPRCPVSAETGGKNAMILTSSCDRDHAIKNILSSAFSNAGQKCSACSLLILEKDIYEDEVFKEKLKDAVLSLHAGSAWEHGNFVGPMISPKNEKLYKAFHLEPGESWLVEPAFADEKKYVMKPAVKWGVKPGSFTFTTELFAPLLAVVCMKDLEEGIRIANSSEYGLTAGLQSLDENEQELWRSKIEAGNLYINRGITGAIVSRQPFGGMKRSALGAGIKAGGPNYAVSFMSVNEMIAGDVKRLEKADDSYEYHWKNEFSQEKDIHNIHGEENIFRYLPLKNVVLRVFEHDSPTDILLVVKASRKTKTPLYISFAPDLPGKEKLEFALAGENIIVESDASFIENIGRYERVRTCSPDIPVAIYEAAAVHGIYIACTKPVAEGRIELLNYLREQSISYEYHRYGNILEE